MIQARRQPPIKGFTLIEVLVALAVLSIALGALVQGMGANARNISRIIDKTMAHWVAVNQSVEVAIIKQWPSIGIHQGTAEQGGRQWRWTLNVSPTVDQNLRKLEFSVTTMDSDAVVATLLTFRGKTP